MLEIFVAWVYIFITSFGIGHLCIEALAKLSGIAHQKQSPVLYSVTGLVVIMILGGYLSLFMPMGLGINMLISVLSLGYLILNRAKLAAQFSYKGPFTLLNISKYVVMAAVLVTVLIKASGPITTPDSAGYHLPFIKWIEHYKAVKGIANVHSRFGFNYQYHILCAIYGMSFMGIPTIHALNGYLMVALVGYMITGMSIFKTGTLSKYDAACLIAVLFVFNMSNASSSFSPDFPTTAMIMFAILLFLQRADKGAGSGFDTDAIMIFIITIGATLFKISSLPIVLLNLYYAWPAIRRQQWKFIAVLFAAGILAAVPYMVRNYIISGYLVYPLYAIDIFNVPWKLPYDKVVYEKEMVKLYALGLQYGQHLTFSETISSWWQYLKASNRVYVYIMGLLGVCVVTNIFWILCLVAKGKIKEHANYIGIFALLYLCLIYWWLNAPDPRFGNGYIISFMAITISISFYTIIKRLQAAMYYGVMLLLVVLAAGMIKGQSLSKVDNNFKKVSYNFISQEPYPVAELQESHTEAGQVFYRAPKDGFCWDAAQPCMFYNDTCKYMGQQVDEGFAPVK